MRVGCYCFLLFFWPKLYTSSYYLLLFLGSLKTINQSLYIYIFDTSCIECVPVFGLLFLSIQNNFSLDVGL